MASSEFEKPNAALHLHRGAEQRNAYHKRTALPGVRCKRLIMIEASPSAYPSGMLAVGKTKVHKQEETSRRFSTTQHPFYCGIDLHARSMDVCVVRQEREILLHRNRKAAPEPFLTAVAPSRDGRVVAVECLCTWSWLADLWVQEGLPFVLGHALSMKALHGGKATNDQIDSHKIAAVLRGGMLPQASVSPAEMRATRDLRRRRTPLMRKRAALLAHGQHTNSHYHVPEIGKQIADKAHRHGGAERCDDAAVHKTMAVDLALLTSDDALLTELELSLLTTAQHHDAHTLSLVHTVPGLGTMLRRVLRYAIHDIRRCPRVPDFASYTRLGKCRKASGGKRLGTSGKKIGQAHRTWAFSEAAPLFLRNNEPGQKLLARLEKQHATGKALSILAHTWGRAISSMRKRTVAFAMERVRQTEGSRAGEPGASLDPAGDAPASSTPDVRRDCVCARHGVHRPCSPERWRLIGYPLWLLTRRRWSPPGACAAPPPRLALTGESTTLRPPCASDGMRGRHYCSVAEGNRHAALPSPQRWRLHRNTCVVPPCLVGTWARKSRQNTGLDAAAAGSYTAEKKQKIRSQG